MNEGAPSSVIDFDQLDLDPSDSTVFDLPRTEPGGQESLQPEPEQNQTTPEQNFGGLEPGHSPAELAARDEQIEREAQQLFDQQSQEMRKAAAAEQAAREIEEIKKLNAAANDQEHNQDLYARASDFPAGKDPTNFKYVDGAIENNLAGLFVTTAEGKPDLRFEDGSLASSQILSDSDRNAFFAALASREKTENGTRAVWHMQYQGKEIICIIAIDENDRVLEKLLTEKDPIENQPQQKQLAPDDSEPQTQTADQDAAPISGLQTVQSDPFKIFAPLAAKLAAAFNREGHNQVPPAADLPAQARQNTESNAQAITGAGSIEHNPARNADNSVPENQPAIVAQTDLVQPGAIVLSKSNEAQNPAIAELDLDESIDQDSKPVTTVEASIAGATNSTSAAKAEAMPTENSVVIEANQDKTTEQYQLPAEQLVPPKDQREPASTAAELIAQQFQIIEAATGITIEQSQSAQIENSAAANQPAQREQKTLDNTAQPTKATIANPAKTFESSGIGLIVGSDAEAQSADQISSDTPFDTVMQQAINFEQLGSGTFVATAPEIQNPATVETAQAADASETSASETYAPDAAAPIRRSDAAAEGKNIPATETAYAETEIRAEPESNIPIAEINNAKSPASIPRTLGTPPVNSRLKPNANAGINREIPDFTAVIDPKFALAPSPKPTPRPDTRSEIQTKQPEQLKRPKQPTKQPAKVAFINNLPHSKSAANFIAKDPGAAAAEQIRSARQEHRAVKNLLENRRSAEIQKRFGAAGRVQDQDQIAKRKQPLNRKPAAVRQLSLAA